MGNGISQSELQDTIRKVTRILTLMLLIIVQFASILTLIAIMSPTWRKAGSWLIYRDSRDWHRCSVRIDFRILVKTVFDLKMEKKYNTFMGKLWARIYLLGWSPLLLLNEWCSHTFHIIATGWYVHLLVAFWHL